MKKLFTILCACLFCGVLCLGFVGCVAKQQDSGWLYDFYQQEIFCLPFEYDNVERSNADTPVSSIKYDSLLSISEQQTAIEQKGYQTQLIITSEYNDDILFIKGMFNRHIILQ